MLDFLWNLHQQSRISALEGRVATGKTDNRGFQRVVSETVDRVDALVLLNIAMWSIVEEKLGVTESELAARVERIDLEDGKLDGRRSAPPVRCAACGRTVGARHPHCIYCGAAMEAGGAFGRV